MFSNTRIFWLAIACLSMVVFTASSRAGEGGHGAPVVAPLGSTPEGQAYGRWAAEWWQWALGVPAATNPVLDPDGSFCAERQVGEVWFLAGRFGFDPDFSVPTTRTCTVPTGKSLFFPLINNFAGAFLDDPAEERT